MTEPEEIIEARLVSVIASAVPHLDVQGALSPVPTGEQKNSPDTFVSVFVDLASQGLDWRGPGVPCTYSVRVTVRYAQADDASGTAARDACRSVRTALHALTGDGCEALSGGGFECDAFTVDTTQTALDQDADGGGGFLSKTYTATATGRTIQKES